MKKSLTAIAAVAFVVLAGCEQQESITQVPASGAIAQAPAQQDSGIGDMLLGGAVGYFLGSMSNKPATQYQPVAPSRSVINRTVIVRQPAPAPNVPTAPVAAPKSKTNFFGDSTSSVSRSSGSSYRGSYRSFSSARRR